MLQVGTILHGTYRIDGYLSSGGFGNTYVATNIEFGEKYAIKEFFWKGVSQRDGDSTTVSVSNVENGAAFASQLEKFKKEARRLRRLNSEHIVRVYDLFEENGTAYYVMDFVDGENLSERLKRTGQPLSEYEVNRLLPQILDALDAAHQAGILHLDLKPANIMVDKQGKVKLIDFGASKQQSATGGATATSAIAITKGFAPREQQEQNPDKFGPWTDFYALGATLYNLLTNRRPTLPSDIDDDDTPDKHIALPMPPSVSDKTKKLVVWLMATNRKNRPQSVEQIRAYLDGKYTVNLSSQSTRNHSADVADSESTQLMGKTVQSSSTTKESEEESGETEDVEEEVRPLFFKLLSYHGRIRRTEYWLSFLLPTIPIISFLGIAMQFKDQDMGLGIFAIVSMLVYWTWAIWIIFQSIKRCHDINISGWYQLIPLFFIVLLFKGGDEGKNDYGEDPRGDVSTSEACSTFFKSHSILTIALAVLLVLGIVGIVKAGSNQSSNAIYQNMEENYYPEEVVDTAPVDTAPVDTVSADSMAIDEANEVW